MSFQFNFYIFIAIIILYYLYIRSQAWDETDSSSTKSIYKTEVSSENANTISKSKFMRVRPLNQVELLSKNSQANLIIMDKWPIGR